MKRYWFFAIFLLAFFLAAFVLASAFHVAFLEDPTRWMQGRGGILAAAAGVALLIADVFLPVPSSLVMIAHGALFGVWIGTALSLAGSVGATLFGFWVGRRGGRTLERLVSHQEKVKADALLARWGALAILVSRPLPLLAETVAILAGASAMGWGKAALAGFLGCVPMSLLYAFTGATAQSLGNDFLMFGIVLAIAAVFWFAGKKASG
jgi:uncharacterized membrane protein YdjX (TVP38/TMEM64 family)